MENIGGIFVVLICGLIIAVFVAVMEFIWSTRRSAESEEVRRLTKAWGKAGETPRDIKGPKCWVVEAWMKEVGVCKSWGGVGEQEVRDELRNSLSDKGGGRSENRQRI